MRNLGKICTSVAVATTAVLGVSAIAEAASLTREDFSQIEFQPLIMAGDPNGNPPDSPANRVDPNTTTSPFAGVGSLKLSLPDEGENYLCSGAAIARNVILTAAHCLDVKNEDGIIDLTPENVTFNLNFGSDLSHSITASALAIHPDYQGFENTVNSDMALITLSSNLPKGVPIYKLNRKKLRPDTEITMAGYGTTGNGTSGLQMGTASPSIKRTGQNEVENLKLFSSLLPNVNEIFMYDFDGPDDSTNAFAILGSGLTLGNNIESIVGPGDSGGPSFITNKKGKLLLAGVNTFAFSFPEGFGLPGSTQGKFGTGAGGISVSDASKLNWIDSVLASLPPSGKNSAIAAWPEDVEIRAIAESGAAKIPEPSPIGGLIILGAGWLWQSKRQRGNSRRSRDRMGI